MKVIQPPQPIDWHNWTGPTKSIFLAGSIEMGKAEKWQDEAIESLKDYNCVILNPRRDSWDSSWTQSIDNPQFNEQVNWELDGLIKWSDINFFYFHPATYSPITLMELGYCFSNKWTRKIVVCPEGFWRKGNIEILCNRNNIKIHSSLEEGLEELKKHLGDKK